MKALRYFSGYDTFGRLVERAQSVSGQWFMRYQYEGGYGLATSEWQECETPNFETHYTNKYTGEREKCVNPVILCGFTEMEEHKEVPRVRLPNAA